MEDFDHAHKYADVAARIAAKIAAEDDDGFDKYPHAEIWGESRSWESLEDYRCRSSRRLPGRVRQLLRRRRSSRARRVRELRRRAHLTRGREPDVDPNVDDRLERLEARFDRLDHEVSASACRLFTDAPLSCVEKV